MALKEVVVLSYRHFVNDANQIEGVELVKETVNPDGILQVKYYKEVSPRPLGTHRPYGRLNRLPDKPIPVKLMPTGEILGDATLISTENIIEQWIDYGPLIND